MEKHFTEQTFKTRPSKELILADLPTAMLGELRTSHEFAYYVFARFYNQVEKRVDFNRSWLKSGDVMVSFDSASLQSGEVAKSIDDHERPILLVGTPLGVACVRTRYEDSTQLQLYAPKELRDLLKLTEYVDQQVLKVLFGNGQNDNIGHRLAAFKAA